jgi:predicted O-methyltransferase YrrM
MKFFFRILYNALPIFNKENFLKEFIIKIYFYAGFPYYLICNILNRPYIGSYMFSDQESGRQRLKVINECLKKIKKIKKKISILEIGVYCGQNTLNLYKNLKNKNKVFHYCVDIFRAFEISDRNKNFHYKKIHQCLNDGQVYELFIKNISSISSPNYLFIIKKMLSQNFFKFNKNKFDLIVVDASHQYKYVFNDIKNSLKNLNDNGILICDDYEIEAKNFTSDELKKHLKTDTLLFENKYTYHPGVTLAVKNIFGNLKSRNGLCAIQKRKNLYKDLFK